MEALGYTYTFSDGGWLQVAKDLTRARSLALVKLLIFTGAALFALLLTAWLYIGRKKMEYGILRALGMKRSESGAWLYVPFLLLGVLASALGLFAARILSARQLVATGIAAHSGLGLMCLGALGFLVFLALIALVGLLLIQRRSVLELIQEKRK